MSSEPLKKVSIIMPTLNEAEGIVLTLQSLQLFRSEGHELIVVDAGSDDNTVALAKPLADQVISSERGRAMQMNAGAKLARGDILLFIHADTTLPENAMTLMCEGLQQTGKCWGRFDLRLSGRQLLLRIVERLINLRSRLTGIASGDQAIFIRRGRFLVIDGFPEIPLMEDISISRTLKFYSDPLCLKQPVLTSSRRWEQHGIIRTILLMWRLRLSYYLGADPAALAQKYQ